MRGKKKHSGKWRLRKLSSEKQLGENSELRVREISHSTHDIALKSIGNHYVARRFKANE